MFRLKVCGVTRIEDVRALIDCGCDAMGLNFVKSSPRWVSCEKGAQLSRAASGRLLRVGVVMNPTHDEILNLLERVELDALQLHGSEAPQLLASCVGLPVIKALSWSGQEREVSLAGHWRREAGGQLAAFLVDAVALGAAGEVAAGVGGGSGRTANWQLLNPRPKEFEGIPLILAGGLRPDNVAQAIETSRCDGVDTASGVESAPGIKDSRLVREFANRARAALSFRDNQHSAARPQ